MENITQYNDKFPVSYRSYRTGRIVKIGKDGKDMA